ncbi:MAG: ATP synthase F1 subunit epsilon [Candidatus Saccharibacteria bacterium]|nr:ATP synthase F1 subunit epsilon [Candidatus Saccharibacteria bacterium]
MIEFELVTLNGIKLSESVHEVLLPTPQGQIAVFENHAPLVSTASTGVISVRRKSDHPDDMMEHYAIDSGVIEISGDKVRVLVDEADKDSDISAKEAEEALAKAKQIYAEAKDQVSLDKAQSLVDRQASRLHIAELRRRTRR